MWALLVAVVVYACAESAWLYSTGHMYLRHLSQVLGKQARLASPSSMPLAYVGIYALLISAAWWLVMRDVRKGTPVWESASKGALLGAACYGTYNLTNQITLPGYSGWVSLVDTAWGAFAIGLLCSVYTVMRR
jgi:uncharacterized membrane protein